MSGAGLAVRKARPPQAASAARFHAFSRARPKREDSPLLGDEGVDDVVQAGDLGDEHVVGQVLVPVTQAQDVRLALVEAANSRRVRR